MTTTDIKQEKKTDDLENLRTVCTYYKVPFTGVVKDDVNAISKAVPAFAPAYGRHQDVGLALEEISRIVEDDVMVPGWLVAHGTTKWVKASGGVKGHLERKVGARILSVDNRVHEIEGLVLKGNPIETKVMLGPMRRAHNIITGETRLDFKGKRNAVVQNHSVNLPITDIGRHVTKLNETVDERSRTLRTDSGDFPVLISGRVGTGDRDVSYFPGGAYGESLKIIIYGENSNGGFRVGTKLDPAIYLPMFGLAPGCDGRDVRAAMQDQPVIGMGKLGIGYPIGANMIARKLGCTEEQAEAQITTLIEDLQKQGLLQPRSGKRGTTHHLNLLSAPENVKSIKRWGVDIIGVDEELDTEGNRSWKCTVLATSNGGQPWFSIKKGEFTSKNAEGDEESGVRNPDSFLVFASLVGASKPKSNNFGSLSDLKIETLDRFNGVHPTAATVNPTIKWG